MRTDHQYKNSYGIPGSVNNSNFDHYESKGHEGINNKKLLVICHSYNNFQKDSIEGLSRFFKEIRAFVRINSFAGISKFIPWTNLDRFTPSYKIDLSHKPSNVTVIPTSLYYFPGDIFYKSLGLKHFNTVSRAMKRYNFHFDFIHSHFTWSAGYVGARLKEEISVPFVVTAHGYDIYSLPFKDQEWREKIEYVLNSADHIITVSKSNLACIKKLEVSSPVSVIPNGFRSDLFYPRETSECRRILGLPSDLKIILTVGNLEPIKGQKYLIETIREVIRERKDILCVIIGSGKLHTTLMRQIISDGLEDYIIMKGGKPHDEIPLWMNACDRFVLPSLNEGNPTVMFEALGCGKPFVGTRVGGVPEIIISDEYGLLAEPTNPDDLAEKILVALDREWDREAILAYAERFTWENVVKEIMGVYEQVLGRNLDEDCTDH